MIGFAVTLLSWAGATIIPALIGLVLISAANRKVQSRYLIAFAIGIFFWFFVDTISGSAGLDVNSGFKGGSAQIEVVILFLTGVVAIFAVDRKRAILWPQSAIGKYGMAIPYIVAFAIGIHGLGEGIAFGGTANSTTSTSIIDTFGGWSPVFAYFLHKGLEPMIIGACYTAYFRAQNGGPNRTLRNILLLTGLFTATSLV